MGDGATGGIYAQLTFLISTFICSFKGFQKTWAFCQWDKQRGGNNGLGTRQLLCCYQCLWEASAGLHILTAEKVEPYCFLAQLWVEVDVTWEFALTRHSIALLLMLNFQVSLLWLIQGFFHCKHWRCSLNRPDDHVYFVVKWAVIFIAHKLYTEDTLAEQLHIPKLAFSVKGSLYWPGPKTTNWNI